MPRYHNNYVGMRNRFALLSEAYAYATFEDRIKATNYFVEEALNFAQRERRPPEEGRRGRRQGIDRRQDAKARARRSSAAAWSTILMGEVEDEKNPVNGATMNRRKDVVHDEQMIDMLWFEPTKTEDVPHRVLRAGDRHEGASSCSRCTASRCTQITAPVRGVEQFTITSNTQRPANANSIDTGAHGLRTLDGTWAAAADVTVPAGAWVVPMNQPLARLAFYLLAPTSDDGLVAWNYLDDCWDGREDVSDPEEEMSSGSTGSAGSSSRFKSCASACTRTSSNLSNLPNRLALPKQPHDVVVDHRHHQQHDERGAGEEDALLDADAEVAARDAFDARGSRSGRRRAPAPAAGSAARDSG